MPTKKYEPQIKSSDERHTQQEHHQIYNLSDFEADQNTECGDTWSHNIAIKILPLLVYLQKKNKLQIKSSCKRHSQQEHHHIYNLTDFEAD